MQTTPAEWPNWPTGRCSNGFFSTRHMHMAPLHQNRPILLWANVSVTFSFLLLFVSHFGLLSICSAASNPLDGGSQTRKRSLLSCNLLCPYLLGLVRTHQCGRWARKPTRRCQSSLLNPPRWNVQSMLDTGSHYLKTSRLNNNTKLANLLAELQNCAKSKT